MTFDIIATFSKDCLDVLNYTSESTSIASQRSRRPKKHAPSWRRLDLFQLNNFLKCSVCVNLPNGGFIQKNTRSDSPKWALGPLEAPAMEVVFPLW